MSRVAQDFTDLLLKQGVISLDQLNEAEEVAKSTNADVGDVLVQMEYASPEAVAEAMAKFHKIPYVDLGQAQIAESVIELVPESVARENNVLPFSEEDGALRILIADPFDIETIEKLRFILNRKIETALAPKKAILGAINRYYGQVEGESADSMLQEFTDTAIDFTETDADGESAEQDVDDEQRPGDPAGQFDDPGSRSAAGKRHSRRTVRGPGANSLPDRWRLCRTRKCSAPNALGHHRPHQDPLQNRHLRKETPHRWADQDHRRGQATRPAGQHHPYQSRSILRDAAARQGQHQSRGPPARPLRT